MQRFSSSVYRDRVARAQQLTAEAEFAALVVTPGPDLEYLIGARAQSFERLLCLVVGPSGPTLVVPRLELAALGPSAAADLDIPVRDWVDGQDPYRIVAEVAGDGVIGISEATPALHVIGLADIRGSLPRLATAVLRQLRMIKQQAEIEALRRAGQAIDRVHARMGEWLQAGRTERAVASDIAEAIVAEGHAAVDFVIVGSGPHGGDPHHEVSDRMIEAGDIIVVDIGGTTAAGYHSDCTRTYSVGSPEPVAAQQYEVLYAAQRAAVGAVRPGVTAAELDAVARDLLSDAGLGEYFVHRTGHGIGLSVHEEPYIVAGNDIELEPGMVFSIEPGIYFRGSWGARIEDIVVVTTDGCERLNQQPRALTVL